MPHRAPSSCTLNSITMWACSPFSLRKTEASAGLSGSSNKLWLLKLSSMSKTHATRELGCRNAQASGVAEAGTVSFTYSLLINAIWKHTLVLHQMLLGLMNLVVICIGEREGHEAVDHGRFIVVR